MDHSFSGMNPAITEAPTAPSVHELFRRDSSELDVLLAPDNTCGYASGRSGAIYSCLDTTARCGLITALSALACFTGSVYYYSKNCADAQAVSTSICDIYCQQDINTLKCTDATAPYCGTLTYMSTIGITGFYCDSISASIPIGLLTTYSGEKAHTFEMTSFFYADPLDSSTIDSSSSTTTTVSSSTTTNQSATSTGEPSSGPPVGAIVGGTVGGVAIIALVGFGVWFVKRRNKKPDHGSSSAHVQPSFAQVQPGSDPSAPFGGSAHMHQPLHGSAQAILAPGYAQPPVAGGGAVYPGAAVDVDQKSGVMSSSTLSSYGMPTSPTQSSMSDPHRLSLQPISPVPTGQGYPQTPPAQGGNVPPTVYEAGGDAFGDNGTHPNHRGQFHEVE
ncbi:hypothetical protein BX600DRAFT_517186 [Xylariales sp. PMI_506]|nr:hypothetical protein BX600DRAFT_517186 [Xylariales sp. PMI_506]